MPAPETPVAIAIGADVYELEKATTLSITLVHRVTQERRTLTLGELADLLPASNGPSPRLFDTLPKHVIKAATVLATDIDEVLTGVGRNANRRPEYDIESTSQEQRVTRKLREMAEGGRGMARSSFFRKLNAYRREGLVGLVDGRALREFRPELVDGRVVAVFVEVVNEQLDRSTGTIGRIIQETTERVQAMYGARVKIPSRSSYYNLAKAYGAAKHATGSAKTRRSLGKRPDRTFGMTEPMFPGELVEIDTNTMDIEVRTPDNQRKRPRLTIMLDVYTRSIISYTIRLEATKSVDHVLLLAQAATPRGTRPPRQWLRDQVQRRHPNITLMSAEEYDTHSQAMPFIFPRSVSTDRGADYKGSTFHAAAGKLQCSVILSPPHTPTGKPHVERLFGTINSLFTQHLPGYIGRSAEHRGIDVPTEKLLTVEALRELFEDWVIRDWQNRPHSALRDPLHRTRQLTPNQMAERAAITAAQFRFPLTRDDYIRMLDSHFRKVGSTGVRCNGRQYDSPELHPLRNQQSPHPRYGGKWEVKVDPYNPACVWVVGRDGHLIECPERGAETRIYQPDFPTLEDDYRALTARADAEITGAPFPEPTLPALPEQVAVELDDDEDDYIPNF